MKQLPYTQWHRYTHAEFSARMAIPYFHVEAPIDVTRLLGVVREQQISFYFALIWATTKVMERREDFRWRLRGDTVVLIDSPEPSFTDMAPGSELYKIVGAGMAGDDMVAYARRARAVSDAQEGYFPPDTEEARDDMTYFSCVPGFSFTSMGQALDTGKDNFIPAVAWSRYYERDGRILLPYFMQCNHRLVDGFHVARFYRELEDYLHALD